ncbi:MAG: type VI secretion system contractile sheath large subunit [Acidobacteria bacterium]|nr:type VI secretion system contractile sheath large subunit [Acidobacteriota bacterium]
MSSDSEQMKAESVVIEEQQSLLERLIDDMRVRDNDQRESAKSMLSDFLLEVVPPGKTVSKNTVKRIQKCISDIDKVISEQLNEIMHHEEFQKLEASWRGLRHLVFESETSTMLKIRVMNVSKKELLADFEDASEFDQSHLWRQVYDEEYGVYGGDPIGALVGDYEFSNGQQDVALLQNVAGVAAAAHAPFISAASPEMFGWDSFTQLTKVRDLAKLTSTKEHIKWQGFRESEDSRYVGLCLPHTLMRVPYGKDKPTETFEFKEDVDGKDHKKYLWGNAAYSFATRLTEAFSLYHWCVAIRGPEGGGMVRGLPTHTFRTDEGDLALKCPTEIAITERRDREFADLGFIPLVHHKNRDFAAFFTANTPNKPPKYNKPSANANARLSMQLPYIFATSRIAHYLKAIMRDKIGGFMSREDCERYMNTWISSYVSADDAASPSVKAQFPLREARIDVEEIPGKPGAYKAAAYLRPHFQLDELTIALRLVAALPPPAKP